MKINPLANKARRGVGISSGAGLALAGIGFSTGAEAQAQMMAFNPGSFVLNSVTGAAQVGIGSQTLVLQAGQFGLVNGQLIASTQVIGAASTAASAAAGAGAVAATGASGAVAAGSASILGGTAVAALGAAGVAATVVMNPELLSFGDNDESTSPAPAPTANTEITLTSGADTIELDSQKAYTIYANADTLSFDDTFTRTGDGKALHRFEFDVGGTAGEVTVEVPLVNTATPSEPLTTWISLTNTNFERDADESVSTLRIRFEKEIHSVEDNGAKAHFSTPFSITLGDREGFLDDSYVFENPERFFEAEGLNADILDIVSAADGATVQISAAYHSHRDDDINDEFLFSFIDVDGSGTIDLELNHNDQLSDEHTETFFASFLDGNDSANITLDAETIEQQSTLSLLATTDDLADFNHKIDVSSITQGVQSFAYFDQMPDSGPDSPDDVKTVTVVRMTNDQNDEDEPFGEIFSVFVKNGDDLMQIHTLMYQAPTADDFIW